MHAIIKGQWVSPMHYDWKLYFPFLLPLYRNWRGSLIPLSLKNGADTFHLPFLCEISLLTGYVVHKPLFAVIYCTLGYIFFLDRYSSLLTRGCILYLLITYNLNPSMIFNSCSTFCHLSFQLILPNTLTQHTFTVIRISRLQTVLCPFAFFSSYLLNIYYLVIDHYINSLSYALYSFAPFLLLYTYLANHQLYLSQILLSTSHLYLCGYKWLKNTTMMSTLNFKFM